MSKATKYTVVGLWMSDYPPSRVAAWVEAQDPEEAITRAENGEGNADGRVGDIADFLVAGVFEGHLSAVDEQ